MDFENTKLYKGLLDTCNRLYNDTDFFNINPYGCEVYDRFIEQKILNDNAKEILKEYEYNLNFQFQNNQDILMKSIIQYINKKELLFSKKEKDYTNELDLYEIIDNYVKKNKDMNIVHKALCYMGYDIADYLELYGYEYENSDSD